MKIDLTALNKFLRCLRLRITVELENTGFILRFEREKVSAS